MLYRAREVGPALLVPLAWGVTSAAHADLLTDHAMFVAHVVMTVCLAAFAVTGRPDMREGLLEIWWAVIVVGFFVTLAGTASFPTDSAPLAGVALFGWMLLPAGGFLATARRVPEGAVIYLAGAAGCAVGVACYAAGLWLAADALALVGLASVGLGQTAGILDAVVRY